MLYFIAEETRENLRREVFDLRRQLNEYDSNKSSLETTIQDLRRQLHDAEVEKMGQSRALIEVQERLERSERENRSLREESKISPQITVSRSHDDVIINDLKQKLADCEHANLRLQQNCAELRTNLGEEIANLEEVKQYVFLWH